jgi:photosystem II stability/assembly factor-like uncharacterized protein
MKTHIMRALGAAGLAGALSLLCLTGASSAASASPAAQAAHTVPVAALKVPGNFQPGTASFVSRAWGVVLGGSGCTNGRPCQAQLAVTADGGAHWSLMRAPAVSLSQVSQVLFANRADGWLYNPYLSGHVWVTHNGGASWREITLPGNVETMAASARTVYAVVGSDLYRSPVCRNGWTRVNARTPYGPMTGTTLAVAGNSVWFASNTFVWTTADGAHWARYALHSPGTAYGVPYGLSGIAAANPRDVAFLWGSAQGMYHTVMKVQVSVNGGRTERLTPNAPPSEGDTAGFAVAPGRFGVLLIAVVTPGQDLIYCSANLGETWTTFGTPGTQGGILLSSLQFMSPAAACYVWGDPAVGEGGHLMLTANAGRTWYSVAP